MSALTRACLPASLPALGANSLPACLLLQEPVRLSTLAVKIFPPEYMSALERAYQPAIQPASLPVCTACLLACSYKPVSLPSLAAKSLPA
jgi:hypothetical protein